MQMFSLANIGIGKVIVAFLIVSIAGLFGYVYVLKIEIKLLNQKSEISLAKYNGLKNLVEANKVDYEKNLEFAESEQIKMRSGYEAKIKKIGNWRVKNEKINCKDSLNFINNYDF
jgi:hypothetical protein